MLSLDDSQGTSDSDEAWEALKRVEEGEKDVVQAINSAFQQYVNARDDVDRTETMSRFYEGLNHASEILYPLLQICENYCFHHQRASLGILSLFLEHETERCLLYQILTNG